MIKQFYPEYVEKNLKIYRAEIRKTQKEFFIEVDQILKNKFHHYLKMINLSGSGILPKRQGKYVLRSSNK